MEEDIRKAQEGINREIIDFLGEEAAEAGKKLLPPEYVRTIETLRQFILRGGKRLRPFLFFQGYLLSGGREEAEALRASISMEFLHAGLLIQDDVMDRDDKRHGGLSVFAQYEQDYADGIPAGDLMHFAYSMAICASDIALSWSSKVLAGSGFDDKDKSRALAKLSEILAETALGQMLDETSQFGQSYEEGLVYAVQDFKTARYSVVGPLQMGAILAGAPQSELDLIADFARPLGIAYQIQDDILGVFGETEVTGKPVGADLREGKKTLLVSYAMEHASLDDRGFLVAHLGRENLGNEEMEKMQAIIRDCGALRYSEERIGQLFEESKRKMEDGSGGGTSRYIALQALADLLLSRKK